MQQRIHPAASRVKMLSEATPASFVAFDFLALGDEDLRANPFCERRAIAVRESAWPVAQPPIYLTPTTDDNEEAQRWFAEFEGAGLDGVIAKNSIRRTKKTSE